MCFAECVGLHPGMPGVTSLVLVVSTTTRKKPATLTPYNFIHVDYCMFSCFTLLPLAQLWFVVLYGGVVCVFYVFTQHPQLHTYDLQPKRRTLVHIADPVDIDQTSPTKHIASSCSSSIPDVPPPTPLFKPPASPSALVCSHRTLCQILSYFRAGTPGSVHCPLTIRSFSS